MRKIEIILLATVGLALILKISHVTGSAFLAMLSFMITSMFYYVFSFALFNNISARALFSRASYRNTTPLRILGAVAAGIGIASLFMDLLYRILNFQGAFELMMAGAVPMFVVLVLSLWKYARHRDAYYTGIMSRIAIAAVIAFVCLFFQ